LKTGEEKVSVWTAMAHGLVDTQSFTSRLCEKD
jgi:hypothetical protein